MTDTPRPQSDINTITAREALQRLCDGNQRFVSSGSSEPPISHGQRLQIARDRKPFAIILGCSDARVPAELIFDQGLGDLFVIRVAGNIVAPSQVGSVEFAAERFGTRLVIVLGHSQCGAVLATIEELQRPVPQRLDNLGSIVDRVRPSVAGLLRTDLSHDMDELIHQAVRSNVRNSVNQLRYGSAILERLGRHDGLRVVGAEYSLETGVVDFFDGEEW